MTGVNLGIGMREGEVAANLGSKGRLTCSWITENDAAVDALDELGQRLGAIEPRGHEQSVELDGLSSQKIRGLNLAVTNCDLEAELLLKMFVGRSVAGVGRCRIERSNSL